MHIHNKLCAYVYTGLCTLLNQDSKDLNLHSGQARTSSLGVKEKCKILKMIKPFF